MKNIHPFSFLFENRYFPKDFRKIDFSISNEALDIKLLSDPIKMDKWIAQEMGDLSIIAYGGYLESRNLYAHNQLFNSKNSRLQNRNIHLGIDFWSSASTPIFSPLDGVIHSFNNNVSPGDYGPTIILFHENNKSSFFSLYGHLSINSINTLKVGDIIKKGDILGYLGESFENGGYAPHLHFQIILDLENNFGDYPGVCCKEDLLYYTSNCPNPELFLMNC